MIGHHFESFCLLKHSELCLLLYVSKVTENTYDEFMCFKSSYQIERRVQEKLEEEEERERKRVKLDEKAKRAAVRKTSYSI